MKQRGPQAVQPSLPCQRLEDDSISELTISISLLAVIFALVAFFYSSVGLDFDGKPKLNFGLGAFTWSNDDYNNTRTTSGVASDPSKPDVDSVNGFELSSAFRGFGLSVDAQYNLFDTETIDSTITCGIYRNGASDLESFSLEAG